MHGGAARIEGGRGTDVEAEGAGAVLACFNRLKKVDKRTWETWLAVLLAVPRSVLWLVRLALSPGDDVGTCK